MRSTVSGLTKYVSSMDNFLSSSGWRKKCALRPPVLCARSQAAMTHSHFGTAPPAALGHIIRWGTESRQSESRRRARLPVRPGRQRGVRRFRPALGLRAVAVATAPPTGERRRRTKWRLRQIKRLEGPPLRRPPRARRASRALEPQRGAGAYPWNDASAGAPPFPGGGATNAAATANRALRLVPGRQ